MKKCLVIVLIILVFFTSKLSAEDGIPIHGFFDIGTGYNQKDGYVSFSTGALDFYISKDINDKINIFIDLVVETDGSGFIMDLERLYIKYDVNEYLQTTLGKFHTPYGYWNTAFHHGLQIQTSILRPKFIAFEDEGGVMSSHGLGILATGSKEDFSYDLYITSGASIKGNDTSSIHNPKDGTITVNSDKNQDKNKLYGVNLAYYIEDTKIGLHGFHQEVSIFNNRATEVFMYGGYIAMELENLEFYSEVYIFNNYNVMGLYKDQALSSEAYYLQVAYDFDGIKPYARFEYTHYNDKDFYFTSQEVTTGSSYDRVALGVNYSVAQDANVKMALIRTNNHLINVNYNLLMQFAVRF